MSAVAFDLRHPDIAAQEVREANLQLARQAEVPVAVRELIDAISDELAHFDAQEFLDDPLLLVAIEQAAIQAKRALDVEDEQLQRRGVRMALDGLERLLVMLAERQPVSNDQDINQVARWLVDQVRLPARQLAPLLGVHERTIQRWAADPPESTPSGEDERLLRTIAQLIAQLRYVLTAPGVIAWMTRPDDRADGRTPADLLRDPAALPTLLAWARSLRSLPFT